MKAADIASLLSAAAAVAGVVVAWTQTRAAHRTKRTAAERLDELQSQVAQAQTAARAAANAADEMVQRAKEPGARIKELQSSARVIRGNLWLLVEELNRQHTRIAEWQPGDNIRSGSNARRSPEARRWRS